MQIQLRCPIDGLIFINTEYLLLLCLFWNMYCLDYDERPHPDDLLSFMLHELVFLGYLSFALCFVKFYNHTLQPLYECGIVLYGCFSNENSHKN